MIVNRGWLPRKLLDQHMASENKEEHGEISLVGVLRHGEEVLWCIVQQQCGTWWNLL